MQRLFVRGENVFHSVSLSSLNPHLAISNAVDIAKVVDDPDQASKANYELAMRIKSDVGSGEIMYTDLNGLQAGYGFRIHMGCSR